MSDKLFETILNWAAKLIVGIIAGSGINQLSGGTFIGRTVLDNYSSAVAVEFVNPEMIPAELYADWSREIVYGSLQHTFGLPALLVFLALILLICHVEYRMSLGTAGPVATSAVRTVYRKYYFAITVGMFGALFVTYVSVHSRFGLVAFFLLISVSAGWYLFRYARDLADALLRARITYLVLGACFVGAFVALPMRYGRHCFDILIRPTVGEVRGADLAEPSLGVCLDERTETFGRVYFDGDKRRVAVQQRPGNVTCGTTRQSLRSIAIDSVAPSGTGGDVLAEAQAMAETAGLY